jgi:hypothetical protein
VDNLDDTEKPHYVELLRLLGAVDGWVARIDPKAEPPQPAPGSPLCADDERTHPYQLSHAAWNSLSHAVDHLNCLHTLLKDARQIHMYAPYSLVRIALENASAAVWMLHPQGRADRVLRRLRFAVNDIRNGEEAKRLTGDLGPRTEEERIAQVQAIAERAGLCQIKAVRKVAYGEIVKAAGGALNPGTDMIFLSWRMCSGIAHGDFWTLFPASDSVELPGAPRGMGTFKITANVKILMYVTTVATHMTSLGWRLYELRCSPPF